MLCIGMLFKTADTRFHSPESKNNISVARRVSQGAVFSIMSAIEQRSVIKFLTRKGVSPNEIAQRLTSVYGSSSLKISAVKRWSQLFRLGRESVEDEERSGRPSEGTSQENIDLVEHIVLDDRRLKVKEIAKLSNLSETTVWRIVHDHLNMSKVSARWVPSNLSAVQKQRRAQISQQFLNLCGDNPDSILSRIVTGDETWVHLYDPESKMESMEWRKPGEAPPRKFKVRPSAGKVMATIFWDQRGIIMIDYLQKGSTITGEYYAEVLKQLRAEIVKKMRGLLASKVLLLQDNAPAHTSKIAMSTVIECGFEART